MHKINWDWLLINSSIVLRALNKKTSSQTILQTESTRIREEDVKPRNGVQIHVNSMAKHSTFRRNCFGTITTQILNCHRKKGPVTWIDWLYTQSHNHRSTVKQKTSIGRLHPNSSVTSLDRRNFLQILHLQERKTLFAAPIYLPSASKLSKLLSCIPKTSEQSGGQHFTYPFLWLLHRAAHQGRCYHVMASYANHGWRVCWLIPRALITHRVGTSSPSKVLCPNPQAGRR